MATLAGVLSLAILQGTGSEIKAKQQEIVAFLKTAKAERELRIGLGELNKLAGRAFDINEYELSAKLYGDAERIARSLKDAQFSSLLADSAKRSLEVGKLFKRAEQAFYRVEEGKGSAADHTDVGRFMCFVKGAWDVGLKHLAEGKDENLKTLAGDDPSGAETAKARLELADRWMEVARKEPGAQDRAVFW